MTGEAVFLVAVGLFFLAGLGLFAATSLREGEKRAARMALIGMVALPGFFFAAAATLESFRVVLAAAVALCLLALGVLLLLPIGRKARAVDGPGSRVDERDIMFSRARLRPGSPEYAAYYSMRPENRPGDDLTRSKPGLLSPASSFFDPLLFSSARGSFTLTEALRDAVDGAVPEGRRELPSPKMTEYLKRLALYYGALDSGVTELEPYHVYSHVGRGSGTYGEEISLRHRFALAFSVEMDFDMIGSSPAAAGLMESARQYVEAARIAVPLAATLRALGYPARAHIDGNYRVIAPLVARDAGLGEIGRMGLLMTPGLGPRVRLGVVTTDAPLLPDPRRRRDDVIDFCTICRKCAHSCPSRSIPFDDRKSIDGALRWKINSETCFRYWSVAGTDCGICMRVCPYSHPDGFVHNAVRWGISRSGFMRRLALHMDDIFYGKNPPPRKPPDWTLVGGITSR